MNKVAECYWLSTGNKEHRINKMKQFKNIVLMSTASALFAIAAVGCKKEEKKSGDDKAKVEPKAGEKEAEKPKGEHPEKKAEGEHPAKAEGGEAKAKGDHPEKAKGEHPAKAKGEHPEKK